MKKTTYFILLMVLACFHSHVNAQYTQIWNNTAVPSAGSGNWTVIGVQNTDADAAKEVVMLGWAGGNYAIYIIDGQSGNLDGQINSFTGISLPSLTDVDGNGKYEILFLGNIGASYSWYLYGLNGTTIVNELEGNRLQASNYPNPFMQTTTIKYSVPENATFVTVKIMDASGNVLKTIVNETKNKGEYEMVFNGMDLSSGMYFYQVNIGNEVGTKKMLKVE